MVTLSFRFSKDGLSANRISAESVLSLFRPYARKCHAEEPRRGLFCLDAGEHDLDIYGAELDFVKEHPWVLSTLQALPTVVSDEEGTYDVSDAMETHLRFHGSYLKQIRAVGEDGSEETPGTNDLLCCNMDVSRVRLPSEYAFLRTDPRLGDRICFLTIAGSKAYGTDLPSSDTDLRGFAIERPRDIYGNTSFEQIEDKATDTVIYGLKKFVSLCQACNPNIIEMLGTKPEHILCINEIGMHLRENAQLFLSKRAYVTFAGYATAQLRRLQNALCHDASTPAQQEEHIRRSLDSMMRKMQEQYEIHAGDMTFAIDQRTDADTPELFTSVHIDRIPLRKFLEINTDIQAMLRNYGKLNKRNKKKDLPHLRKHAMHLVRLYLMGIDILKGEGIQTYREKEHDLLMGIRSGDVPFDEVFRLVDGYEQEIEQAYHDSPLPDQPDEEAINDLLVEIYREYL